MNTKHGILFIGVALLVFCAAFTSIVSAKTEAVISTDDKIDVDNFNQLVDGVAEVVSPGVPGPVWAEDPAWVPIVAGDDDTSFPSTFVMARTCGNGRIVIMGHDGLIGNIDLLDNQQFMLNIISWLDVNGGRKVMYSSGHGEWVTSGTLVQLRTELESRGYTLEEAAAPIDSAFLSQRDVLIFGNAWGSISDSEIGAIESFVSNGGGLFLIGLGWSWEPYNPSTTLEDYPMMKLAAPYGVRWLRPCIVDPTNQDANSTAIFHVFYPDIELPNLYEAFDSMRQTTDAHLHDLPQALEINPLLRTKYVQAHMTISIPTEFPVAHPERQEVYDFCKEIAVKYPDFYTKPPSFDPGVYPAMANIRERFFRTWIDSVELNASAKSEIATLGAFYGKYLDIWEEFSVYLMDNTRLDSAQQQFIYDLLLLIPPDLHNLRVISVKDFLGAPSEQLNLDGKSAAVNIFGIRIGKYSENSFPDDIAPSFVDIFSAVVAHEVNHIVDAFTIANDAALTQRKEYLIAAAGDNHMNYLRSMMPDGFFTESPQEFFASIANEWFTDSAKTIELGLVRFDGGYRHPINQALFFAEVYSRGSDVTYFYNTDTEGHISRTEVLLTRDSQNRIVALRHQGTIYEFTLDASGDVTGYDVKTGVHNIDTGEDFSTIQASIDAVNTTDGHTITVDAGTYYENVVVNKQLRLIGTDMPTVDARGMGTAVIIAANECTVNGFVISGCEGLYPNAGIRIQSNECMIKNNLIMNNNMTGISSSSSNTTIYNNTISFNCIAGIRLEGAVNNTVIDNIIDRNGWTGIYLYSSSQNNAILNNVISNGSGRLFQYEGGYGIAVGTGAHNNLILGNTFDDNKAEGVRIESFGTPEQFPFDNLIYNNYFNNTNNAYDDGINIWNVTKIPGTNIIGGLYLGGNYWNDYTGIDADGDGLGNTPCPIPGGTNKDYLPLVAPSVSVTRDLPDAVSPEEEFNVSLTQSGFYFTGSVTETLPEGFSYRGVLSGGKLFEYDETTNNLTMDFQGGATTLIYKVKAGTAEQIENAIFTGTWTTIDSQLNKISGSIGGETTLTLAEPTPTFDTGSGTYPSISGIHNGTIKPNKTITVSKLYTYPCSGTGGHTEYAKMWNSSWEGAEAHWKGYKGDWHNIAFDKTFTLVANETYNYTIITGSYPQIHHTDALLTANGGINCTEFVDANGKRYNDWIPAIRLE